ncbi:hypothetical protein ACFL22_00075 [Patescibacteria group bacterium]
MSLIVRRPKRKKKPNVYYYGISKDLETKSKKPWGDNRNDAHKFETKKDIYTEFVNEENFKQSGFIIEELSMIIVKTGVPPHVMYYHKIIDRVHQWTGDYFLAKEFSNEAEIKTEFNYSDSELKDSGFVLEEVYSE